MSYLSEVHRLVARKPAYITTQIFSRNLNILKKLSKKPLRLTCKLQNFLQPRSQKTQNSGNELKTQAKKLKVLAKQKAVCPKFVELEAVITTTHNLAIVPNYFHVAYSRLLNRRHVSTIRHDSHTFKPTYPIYGCCPSIVRNRFSLFVFVLCCCRSLFLVHGNAERGKQHEVTFD